MHSKKFRLMKDKMKKQCKDLFKKKQFQEGLHTTTTLDFSMVFLLALLNAFSSVAHFVLLPVAILSIFFETLFFIREPHKTRKQKTNTIISILTAIGLIVGIIGLLIGFAASTAAGLYVMSITLGARSIYELIMAGYKWVMFIKLRKIDPDKARLLRNEAVEFTVNFFCYALSGAALAGLGLTDNNTFASLGVIAGAVGTSYAVYKGYKAYKNHKNQKLLEQSKISEEEFSTNNRYIYESLVEKKPLPQASINIMANCIENNLIQKFEGVEEINDIDENIIRYQCIR